MKKIKVLLAAVLTFALVVGMFGAKGAGEVRAAEKPGAPEVKVSETDNYGEVRITIASTRYVDGYRIFVKAPGAKKYSKLADIDKKGTKKRTYDAENLSSGTYSFRVRAYSKASGKTVWGSFSKVVKIDVVDAKTRAHSARMKEIAAEEYPDLYALVEDGKLGLTMDDSSNVYFTLGSYDMIDRNGNRKEQDIEWICLDYDEDEGAALFISRYVVDREYYHNEFDYITWEECELRSWLNEDFLYEAFSENERKNLILQTEVVNDLNNSYGINGGEDTKDRIFLLSYNEANYYGIYGATLFDGTKISYLLRSPGKTQKYIAYVTEGGSKREGHLSVILDSTYKKYTESLFAYGTVSGDVLKAKEYKWGEHYPEISFDGKTYKTWPGSKTGGDSVDGVRPAMWINMNP
ncbi:MAG: fibronectin type III domain-containing protein [Lachnospiraceae bacterium]|nr:fibronectin type III domain-containing protein [Lachnospiraceae bacterium]